MIDRRDEGDERRFGRLPVLLAAFAAGILFFLATKDPTAGAVVTAAIAGWGSITSGYWVLRTDTDRVRARICFAFQVAAGCWQAAAAAFASVLVFMIAAHLTGRGPDMQTFAATMLVLISGVVLNTLLGLAAVGAALRYRLRVWVHPKLRKTIEEETQLADGSDLCRSRFNYAVFVVGTALVFPVLVVGCVALILISANGAAPNQAAATPVVVMLLAFIGAPLAMILCYAWLSSRIVARSPRQCWPFANE